MIYTVREMDMHLGPFDYGAAQVLRRPSGSWSIVVRIEIPESFRNLDPALFDSQVYLLGRGTCGHHIVLGRSSTLIAPESVSNSFLLDLTREQLNDYGYQVMSAKNSIDFYHRIDFVPSTPSIKLLSLGAQHERGIGKRFSTTKSPFLMLRTMRI